MLLNRKLVSEHQQKSTKRAISAVHIKLNLSKLLTRLTTTAGIKKTKDAAPLGVGAL